MTFPKITTFVFDCFGMICGAAIMGWYRDNINKGGVTDPDMERMARDFDLGIASEEDIIHYLMSYEVCEGIGY
jgi:hypothetical protein